MSIKNIHLNKSFLVLFVTSVFVFFNTIFFSNMVMENYFLKNDKSVYIILSAFFFLSSYLYILFEMNGATAREKRNKEDLDNFKKVLDSSTDGVALLDKNGAILYANNSYALLQGYLEAKDVLFKEWSSFYSADRKKTLETVLANLKEAGDVWDGTSVFTKYNRMDVTHHIHVQKIGHHIFACQIHSKSEVNDLEMIKLAVESANDGMAIVGNDNRVLYMNDSFLRIHGLKIEDKKTFMGTDWRNIYSPKGQENINSFVLPSTIIKGYWGGYLNVMRKDGVMFYGDASLTRLSNNLILGVMRDVTERKSIEKEREKIKEKMYQSKKTEAITRLIKGMGGDFKETLSIIRDRAENAIRKDDVPDERRQYMSDIILASDKASDMLDQIMSFSEGKNTNASIIDVVGLVINVSNKITRGLKSKIKSTADITIDSGHIFGDSGQLQKIIIAVCENSIESLAEGVGAIALSLKDAHFERHEMQQFLEMDEMRQNKNMAIPVIKSKENRFYLLSGHIQASKSYFRITISDTGQGIFPEVLPNVLDPFFTTKNRDKPAGLGLSSVHGTVLSYDGAIIVESEVGVGTAVHLFLPQYIRDESTLTELGDMAA